MSTFDEVGDGIFRRNYASLHLNIGVILGAEAVLVIDSRESHQKATELRDDLNALTSLPVGWVVNTHFHWDHTWGNAVFPEASLWGHARCRTQMTESGEAERQRVIDSAHPQRRDEFEEVVITPPTNTLTKQAGIDIGGRTVSLDYRGRGHTDSDIVVGIDDVLFAGDLIENGAPPAFGDSYPIDWSTTLESIDFPTVVVPGHGAVVDSSFVAAQTEAIAAVAQLAAASHAQGIPIADQLDRGPYPPQTMRLAMERAYAQLNDEI